MVAGCCELGIVIVRESSILLFCVLETHSQCHTPLASDFELSSRAQYLVECEDIGADERERVIVERVVGA
jgi:hypothetical protein